MNSKNSENLFKEILLILSDIRDLLVLQSEAVLEKRIKKLASTPERRKMWILCDGNNSSRKITEEVGVSGRLVHNFIDDGTKMGIIAGKRGFPKRKFDYIPQS